MGLLFWSLLSNELDVCNSELDIRLFWLDCTPFVGVIGDTPAPSTLVDVSSCNIKIGSEYALSLADVSSMFGEVAVLTVVVLIVMVGLFK